MKTLIAIYRDPRFSPNSVEKDRAILDAVVHRLSQRWAGRLQTYRLEPPNPAFEASKLPVWSLQTPPVILSMGRLPSTLQWLSRQQGLIINRPEAVARCGRSTLARLMAAHHIPAPPVDGTEGYWLKRGDACAQERDDVVYCRDVAALAQQKAMFCRRGITDFVVSAHVAGDVVKFYGVRGTAFFRWFYPTDDGETKFGHERRNGAARHYAFSSAGLHRDATRLAEAVGLDVYGGDCIVRADGSYCIIDFNDWPSFSRCREEAAEAISAMVNTQWLKVNG